MRGAGFRVYLAELGISRCKMSPEELGLGDVDYGMKNFYLRISAFNYSLLPCVLEDRAKA